MAATFQSPIKSHVASTVTVARESVGKLLEEAKNNPKAKKLFWVGLAVGMVPFIGGALSYGVERHRNTDIAQKQKQVLSGYFRNQVAVQLGVNPNSVGLADLELAAKVNPMIAGAIYKVNQEKKNADRATTLGAIGSTAAGFIPLPGIGNAAGAVTKTFAQKAAGMATEHAAKIGGGIAGTMASSLFNKDRLHVSDMVEVIDEKKVNGEKITAVDVALLHLAMDADLRKRFEERHKKALHRMSENEQAQVLQQEPELLRTAEPIAEDLNDGRRDVQNVVITGFRPQQTFVQRLNRKAAPELYTQMIDEQRAAAALPFKPLGA